MAKHEVAVADNREYAIPRNPLAVNIQLMFVVHSVDRHFHQKHCWHHHRYPHFVESLMSEVYFDVADVVVIAVAVVAANVVVSVFQQQPQQQLRPPLRRPVVTEVEVLIAPNDELPLLLPDLMDQMEEAV